MAESHAFVGKALQVVVEEIHDHIVIVREKQALFPGNLRLAGAATENERILSSLTVGQMIGVEGKAPSRSGVAEFRLPLKQTSDDPKHIILWSKDALVQTYVISSEGADDG